MGSWATQHHSYFNSSASLKGNATKLDTVHLKYKKNLRCIKGTRTRTESNIGCFFYLSSQIAVAICAWSQSTVYCQWSSWFYISHTNSILFWLISHFQWQWCTNHKFWQQHPEAKFPFLKSAEFPLNRTNKNSKEASLYSGKLYFTFTLGHQMSRTLLTWEQCLTEQFYPQWTETFSE